MHIVGGYRGHPPLDGQQGQGIVAGGVDRVAVVPQLDGQVIATEPTYQVIERLGGGGRTAGGEGGGQRPLAAPGEDLPVAAVTFGQVVEGDDRLPLLPAVQVGLGDGPAEPGVSLGVPGQHDQVGAVRIRYAGTGVRDTRPGDGELGPEHGGQAEGPGRLGEADHAIEAVVVGQGDGGQAESDCLGNQLLGVAGAVEEGEIGVGV